MQHPTYLQQYNSNLEELAGEIASLRYDALETCLCNLADKISSDAKADHERGRIKLAGRLERVAGNIMEAGFNVGKAWNICRPHEGFDELTAIYNEAMLDGIWIREYGAQDGYVAAAGSVESIERLEQELGEEIDVSMLDIGTISGISEHGVGKTRAEACREAVKNFKLYGK